MQKNIIKLEHPRNYHMVGDGFRVTNYVPGYHSDMNESTSPFLMLDYNAPWHIPPQLNHRPGVGFHPHRGFETVTIVYSGEIEHQDTAGNGGVIGADEVQWMTAGSGLLHNEFMTKKFSSEGGTQHAVQLWVNLPQKYKMTNPEYQALTRDNIPEVEFEGGKVRVIAGKLGDISGAARTFSPIELYDIRFDSVSRFDFAIPEDYTTMVLVTEGSVVINEKSLGNGDMIHFSKTGEGISVSSAGNAKILVMAGKPLGENISHYGPFVMNTPQEIEQAFVDLRAGMMGKLDN
ncbi:pirin family protein [Candidatus Gracilibacteria bacterium]|nr:pirin family protein [Candidatus Gracilibacteria bacterium]